MKGEHAQVVFADPLYRAPAGEYSSKKAVSRDGELVQADGGFGRQSLENVFRGCVLLAKHSDSGAIHFICMDWRHAGELLSACREIYSELLDVVAWVRTNAVPGSLYPSQHEPIFVFKSGNGPGRVKIAQLGARRRISRSPSF